MQVSLASSSACVGLPNTILQTAQFPTKPTKSLFRSGLEDILRDAAAYSEHSKTRQDFRCQIEAFEEWITRDAFAEIFLV